MARFSISYDFHNPEKESDRAKMTDYISHLLVGAKCEKIRKFTDSNIFVKSNMTLESFYYTLEEHFGKGKHKKFAETLTISISEIMNGEEKIKLINPSKTLTQNFDEKILAIQNLTPEELEAELAGFVTYFA